MSERNFAASTAQARTERCLHATDEREPHVNALITQCRDEALAQARKADAATAAGRWQGLLHGMPMLIKDNIDTAGILTTSGSQFFAQRVPNQDAPVVQRLAAHGAILLGKTTMHELAFGIRSHNSVSGQCHNPWGLEHVPGGSSGGSGAALAAGMCEGALGTDTGGSVRLPAAMCGVSGLRPTVGRVPNAGSTPVCASQDTVGPMARSVADVARIFAVIAGFEPSDPSSVDVPLENFLANLTDGVDGLRIGLPRQHYFDDAEVSIAQAVMDAAKTLEAAGAKLIDVDVPGADEVHHWATVVIYSDACEFHSKRLETAPERFDSQVLARMRMGLEFSSVDYARAMRQREGWRHRLAHLFGEVDILLSPTVHVPVPPIDDQKSLHAATRDATRNTYAGAFGQIPGLSVPCGFTPQGLPIGLQLEGPWWSEPLLLRAGHAYQTKTDWHLRQPTG